MKALLLIGGILFLLLGLALLVAAALVFFFSRRRAAAPPVAARPQPAPQPPAPAAPMPAVAVAPPPPPAATPSATPGASGQPAQDAATVMIDLQGLGYGALHGKSGTLAGRVFPLDTNGFFIGRDRTLSQLVIDDPRVSKKHCWVGVRNGAVVAVDQHSTNGTYLNDPTSRITESVLKPGDTLIISDDVARFEYRR